MRFAEGFDFRQDGCLSSVNLTDWSLINGYFIVMTNELSQK